MLTLLIVVVSVLLFLLVIMIHEFGHFIMAKKFGVKVNEFAIGMGPKIISWGKGETKYSLRLFPIGGYCAMEGEDDESEDERAFGNKKVWQRIIIVVAGAVFNIILGFIFVLILQGQEEAYASRTIANFLPTVIEEQEYLETSNTDLDFFFRPSAEEEKYLRIVSEAEYASAEDNSVLTTYERVKDADEGYFYREAQSSATGLMLNDKIKEVDGYKALCFQDAYFAMSLDDDGVMDFVVERDGETITVPGVTFDRVSGSDVLEGQKITVLDFQVYGVQRSFKTVLQSTWLQSQYFVRSVYASLFRIITGRSGFGELSGPVGIASMIGEVAEAGFAESFMNGINNILYIMALITFNLGIVNLLPLPALDGGRLIFLIVEGIRRKPIPPKYEGVVHFIGLMLLLLLMVAITFQDVTKLITGCLG